MKKFDLFEQYGWVSEVEFGLYFAANCIGRIVASILDIAGQNYSQDRQSQIVPRPSRRYFCDKPTDCSPLQRLLTGSRSISMMIVQSPPDEGAEKRKIA
ncbi:MAG: hypothetical protein K8F25_18455 [Fimbriimonadaceae bacterium]|nr:hypothetical protein [Alphaproteobacteria bacterium]